MLSLLVISQDGQSKGYGFVSFDDEYDYQTALSNPHMMLGDTPISVARARHGGGGNKNGGSLRNGSGENGNIRSRRPY